MKKRIATILLSFVLIITLLPVQVFALTGLDSAWQSAINDIADAMVNGKSIVNLRSYNIKTNEIQDLVQAFRDAYPEIFYADPKDYSYYSNENKVNTLTIEYNSLNTAEAKSAFNTALSEMLAQANNSMAPLQKVLAIHNYLVKNLQYDTSVSLSSHDAYSALVNKKTVCDGYSKAFLLAMNKLEIPCVIVRSENMNHAWNQVQLDGEWYNIDVTFDDPWPDRGDEVSYDFFLMSDDTLTGKGHKDWTGGTDCTEQNYESGYDWVSETENLPDKEIFTDVYKDDYYYDAVIWAYENGITDGIGDNKFSPLDSCSRGQVVTFLWRSAGEPEPKTTTNPFTDVSNSQYYYKAVLWAYENGITDGMSETTFEPNAKCKNAQIITFLWRAKGEPAASTTSPSYAGQYYEYSMAWGEENSLYKAMSDGFAPNDIAKRADIVTLMYYCR